MWGLAKHYGLKEFKDPIAEYFANMDKYERRLSPSVIYPQAREQVNISFSKNAMAYEFGFDINRANDTLYVERFLQNINETFTAIMLLERYDESLILLRKATGLSLKDLLYVKHRNKSYKSKNNNDQDMLAKHRRMSKVDYAIYDMFTARHSAQVKAAGISFQKEVAVFQNVLNTVTNFCTPIIAKVKDFLRVRGDKIKSLKSITKQYVTI